MWLTLTHRATPNLSWVQQLNMVWKYLPYSILFVIKIFFLTLVLAVWFSWLDVVLGTKRLPVPFPVRAPARDGSLRSW